MSIACGERVLLPEVRDAAADTLIVADGFSCQEQIEQQTGRRALHLAQVIQMAFESVPNRRHEAFPERRYRVNHRLQRLSGPLLALGLGACAAAGFLLCRRLGHGRHASCGAPY